MNRSILCYLLVLSALILPSSAFAQGGLTPPGLPAPTMKTLDEVEPRTNLQASSLPPGVTTSANYHFIINQAGSYYLSANLVVTKTNGIQINAEGVTVDLSGFEISRASATGNGIEIVTTAHRASIRNGSIKGFNIGVSSLPTPNFARACSFQDLTVTGCITRGIQAGDGAVLESCRAHGNSGADAIAAGVSSTLINCAATNNTTSRGIAADINSTLMNCAVGSNAPATGGQGIVASNGSSLTNCSAYNNTVQYAIFAGAGSSLTNCSAHLNISQYGIFGGDGCSFTNCSAKGNTYDVGNSAGFGTGTGGTLTNCTANGNSTSATGTPTTGMGFDLGSRITIQNSTASGNSGDGINVGSASIIRENTCTGNGVAIPGDAAGIHALGPDNRIEGNNVTGNDRGIDVDSTGNLIIRNTASGNTTQYEIAVNNSYGVIVDDSAGGGAAVNGSSAAATFGNTNAWANFSY